MSLVRGIPQLLRRTTVRPIVAPGGVMGRGCDRGADRRSRLGRTYLPVTADEAVISAGDSVVRRSFPTPDSVGRSDWPASFRVWTADYPLIRGGGDGFL